MILSRKSKWDDGIDIMVDDPSHNRRWSVGMAFKNDQGYIWLYSTQALVFWNTLLKEKLTIASSVSDDAIVIKIEPIIWDMIYSRYAGLSFNEIIKRLNIGDVDKIVTDVFTI